MPWRRHPDATVDEVGGELVLAQVARGTLYRLNASGRAIFRQLERGRTVAELAAALAPELGVAPERVARDAEKLIGELVAGGLLAEVA